MASFAFCFKKYVLKRAKTAQNCSKLATVVIKGVITSFQSSAFQDCSALTSVLFNKDSTVTVSISGMTKAEGTFNETGEAEDAGAYIKFAK